MMRYRLAFVWQKDRVALLPTRLYQRDGVIMFEHTIGMDRLCRTIKAVNLLVQQTLERPSTLAILLLVQPLREKWLRDGLLLEIIFSLQLADQLVVSEKRARVKPATRCHRRLIKLGFQRLQPAELLYPNHIVCERFGVLLLHHRKAPELAFNAVEVAVMIGILGDEALAADMIACLNAFNYMNGKRQPRHPRLPRPFIGEIELRGGCVMNKGFRTKVIDYSGQQVWLLSAHEVNIFHRLLAIGG